MIIGFSGRAESGKSTCANFILGTELFMLNLVHGYHITTNGLLHIDDILGNKDMAGIFNTNVKGKDAKKWLEEEVYPFIRLYSFADKLKQFCIEVLGLTWEQCYTQKGKNSLTHLKWEDMPGIITPEKWSRLEGRFTPHMLHYPEEFNYIIHEPGFMTAREVLQYFGTNVCRKMYNNVWVDATIRQIKEDNPMLAIVTDVRFPNEVEGIQKEEGYVIRLTRDPLQGKHDSETALDKDKYDWNKFDYVVYNTNIDIPTQNSVIHKILVELNIIPGVI